MAKTRSCPKCGAQLPPDAPDAPCPACLMKLGLESWENRNSVAATIDSPASPESRPGFVPPEPAELADRFSQYEILELLGHGGMGAVYKARQKSLDRLVALKIIKPDAAGDPSFSGRFEREAKALAKLNHPNIVSVYDFGGSEGLYYFVMEYVGGMNLRRLIESKELSPDQAIQVIPQICEALQYAHDEGIVHRDIKPENILVDSKGRVKIADFGLAKLLLESISDHALTGTHQVMGTPRYMAPEQMEGARAVDHRADIYSLGVVFYEMLTGELPLGRFDPPSRKATIDEEWDQVVLRTLEKEPGKRYQNASEVKSEVERISDLDRPPARPPGDAVAQQHLAGSGDDTIPNYGMFILGGVMVGLGLLLLMMSTAEGISVFTWVGMGIALGGGGCFTGAFAKDSRLPAGTPVNIGLLLQGGVMAVVGGGLLMFSFSQNRGFWAGNPLVWIGIGLAIGGGGCCVGAWKRQGDDDTTSDGIQKETRDPIRSQLKGPAIALIVLGIINIVLPLVALGICILINLASGRPVFSSDTEMVPVFALPAAAGGIIMLLGGLSMRQCRSYELSMIGLIIAMIPCSPAWIVSAPLALWGLLVLRKPVVRRAFELGISAGEGVPPIHARPPSATPQKKEPISDITQPPSVTVNLVIAWFTFAFAHAVISGLSTHAPDPIVSWALWVAWGIVTPTILCGLVVWWGQRRRGLRYPVHPGEWMWNVHAIAVCLWFVLHVPVFIMQLLEARDVAAFGQVIPTVSFSGFIIVGLVHSLLAAALLFAIREGRWRLYVITFVFGMLARVVAHAFIIAGLWSESLYRSGVAPTALLFAVLPVIPLALAACGDLVEGKRHAWSHWVGITLQACFHLLMLAYVIAQFTQLR